METKTNTPLPQSGEEKVTVKAYHSPQLIEYQQFSAWNKPNWSNGLGVFDKGFESCSQMSKSLKTLIFRHQAAETQV